MRTNNGSATIIRFLIVIFVAVCIMIFAPQTATEAEQDNTKDVLNKAEKIYEVMHSVAEDTRNKELDPMSLIPEDHDELMLWLYCAGFSERDIAAACGTVQNEARICPENERKMLVWCILNRLTDPRTSSCGSTVYEQIISPGQFMVSYATAPYDDDIRAEVEEVFSRWTLIYFFGFDDLERELPEGYCWYSGDGYHNYFRNQYQITGDTI